MSTPKPEIPFTKPVVLDLEPGTYWYCQCGRSQDQPFCDGSHNQEGIFAPLEFAIEEPARVKLCRCKQTQTPPYCDKSHLALTDKT